MKRTFIICLLLIGYILHANNLQVVFRYDDFFLRNDTLDDAVVQIFQKNKIPLVLGIISYNLEEKLIFQNNYTLLLVLKNGVKNKSIEIAQHGFNHQEIIEGEFKYFSKSEQHRRIFKAKVKLDSIFETNIVTFIPPWNTYDENTLTVMQEMGLKNLSSALCEKQAWSNPNINYYPMTIENFGTLFSVLEHNKTRNGVAVVMFHHYSFNKNFTLKQLDNTLKKIQKLNYVKCLTFIDLNEKNELFDESRMNANLEINLLSRILHLGGVIQTNKFAYLVRLINLFLYLTVATILYFVALHKYLKYKSVSNQIKFTSGLAFLILIQLSVWYHLYHPLKTFLFIVFLILLWLFKSKLFLVYRMIKK